MYNFGPCFIVLHLSTQDLPLKEDEVIYAPLSKRQKEIYDETVSVLSKKAQQHQVSPWKCDLSLSYKTRAKLIIINNF